MSEVKDVLIVSCPEGSDLAERVAAVLAEEGITYSVSPSEESAKAVLAVLDSKNSIHVSVAAKVMEAVGSGVPVFSICPEHECCACSETVAMLKKLFAKEEPIAEVPVIEEPVAEIPVIEEPVAEVPVIEEHAVRKCECGAEINGDMIFCWSCGRKIEVPVAEPEPISEPVVPKCSCGAEILPDTAFCWNCGKKIEPAKAETEPVAEPVVAKCSCGADILPDTVFCWNCGSRVGVPASAPEVPKTPKCPGCGADTIPGDKFCFSCGHPLN